MHAKQPIPPPLLRLADAQAAVVTREQALAAGLSRHALRRLVDSGQWNRLSPGLFVTHAGQVAWEGLAWAGVLAGGAGARLGPRSSGHLIGLVAPSPEPVDVLVALDRRAAPGAPWIFVRETPGARSPRTAGTPPRLPAEDVVLDLTASGSAGDVVTVVTDALRMRLTTPERLSAALSRRTRHPHRRELLRLLADADGIESGLELDYRSVERAHGLPKPSRNQPRAGVRYRRDVEYDDFAVLVELDGQRGHRGEGLFRDMRRDNLHALTGRITLRFGWWDLFERPCAVAFTVHQALFSRGYRGDFVRCSNCARVPDHKLVDLTA